MWKPIVGSLLVVIIGILIVLHAYYKKDKYLLFFGVMPVLTFGVMALGVSIHNWYTYLK